MATAEFFGLDIEAGITHALLVCLNQLGAVLLSVFNNAAKGKGENFSCCVTYCLCFFLSLTYHASRARLVSGQAQHALHLGLSPAAAASVVFVADAGAATVSTTATPLDVVLPIIIVAHRRLSYDCYYEKYSEVIRLAVATFAFVGILFM